VQILKILELDEYMSPTQDNLNSYSTSKTYWDLYVTFSKRYKKHEKKKISIMYTPRQEQDCILYSHSTTKSQDLVLTTEALIPHSDDDRSNEKEKENTCQYFLFKSVL